MLEPDQLINTCASSLLWTTDIRPPLLEQVRMHLDFVYIWVQFGASPNTLCRSVRGDRNSSQLSVKALLERMIASQDILEAFRGWNRNQVKLSGLEASISRLRKLLDEKGAEEIEIPFEQHQEQPMICFPHLSSDLNALIDLSHEKLLPRDQNTAADR